jgi:hypothetical protein
MTNSQFDRYSSCIRALRPDFEREAPLPAELRMGGNGDFEVYYAPFDHVTTTAKVVLVGSTPGRTQAHLALKAARDALAAGASHREAESSAKVTASFGGAMRSNIVALLDHVELATKLGLVSCAELWGNRADLVHFTSVLRYPVFKRGKNFDGAGIVRQPLLRSEIDRWFAAECEALRDALFVPLGPAVTQACAHVVATGGLRADQVVESLPHPSPANGERIAYFLGRKSRVDLSKKTDPAKLDRARSEIERRIASWTPAPA